jgi:hypothetical protein
MFAAALFTFQNQPRKAASRRALIARCTRMQHHPSIRSAISASLTVMLPKPSSCLLRRWPCALFGLGDKMKPIVHNHFVPRRINTIDCDFLETPSLKISGNGNDGSNRLLKTLLCLIMLPVRRVPLPRNTKTRCRQLFSLAMAPDYSGSHHRQEPEIRRLPG